MKIHSSTIYSTDESHIHAYKLTRRVFGDVRPKLYGPSIMLALQNRSDELIANVTSDGKDEERQLRLHATPIRQSKAIAAKSGVQLKTGLSNEPQAWP
jgi:hypothetical protein